MRDWSCAALLLRLRLAALAAGAPACAVMALWVLGIGAWAWIGLMPPLPVPGPSVPAAPPASSLPLDEASRNLLLFYDNLGQRRYAEQQVKTVFALAAQAGLELRHGEYRYSDDQAGRFGSYLLVLPVTGSYQAIWDFALRVLGAVPFAALEGISFRRDGIADPAPQARLRLRFYLKDDAR